MHLKDTSLYRFSVCLCTVNTQPRLHTGKKFRTKALSYLSFTEGLDTLASKELGTMLERKTDRTTLSADRDQAAWHNCRHTLTLLYSHIFHPHLSERQYAEEINAYKKIKIKKKLSI